MPRESTSAFAAEVGGRVRRLRAERGLSLSELAHRAGVGKATLSGLEAGTRNPTLETLYAVVGQLGVPLAAVLTEPGGRIPRVEPVHGAAASATLLESFTDGAAITELYRLTIRPGPPQTSPAHPAGVREHLTVFAGTARVGPATEPFTVPAGGHASWTADVPHIYAAEGDETVHASLIIRFGGG
ncbi:helix-turn-helix domain-containing protein [Actinomadura parmotrematis]|uniref:Helix-turn-helix domain-containing protein n=1 Tax=Actinomadura parmotrematis TaxID=2864039 RepID=A0ABS7G086_9ACTN|nr:helix-turn-helix domain-containing protein [Actinomadura parmotrematis]MBW8485971.1 helix-turn-helix domain-containing protein [Actinomadura parmotrematis]